MKWISCSEGPSRELRELLTFNYGPLTRKRLIIKSLYVIENSSTEREKAGGRVTEWMDFCIVSVGPVLESAFLNYTSLWIVHRERGLLLYCVSLIISEIRIYSIT